MTGDNVLLSLDVEVDELKEDVGAARGGLDDPALRGVTGRLADMARVGGDHNVARTVHVVTLDGALHRYAAVDDVDENRAQSTLRASDPQTCSS